MCIETELYILMRSILSIILSKETNQDNYNISTYALNGMVEDGPCAGFR